eukprot:evm.model.NODE_26644_length_6815_cov_38.338516.2
MGTEDRLLVVLDEASGKENKAFSKVMKARITETQHKLVLNDCTSWIVLSNKPLVVDHESSDRRYFIV